MSLDTDFSAVIFNKDLPQSSFVGQSPNSLSAGKFSNAPRTLFDEIGRDLNEDRDAVVRFFLKNIPRSIRISTNLHIAIQSSYDRTQQYSVDSEVC